MFSIFYLILAYIFATLAVKWLRLLSTKFHIGTLPSPRKMHQEFKPLLGGLGFTTGIISAIILAQLMHWLPENPFQKYVYFWIGLAIILLIGLWDDIRGLSSRYKFTGQGLAAILLIMGGCKIQSFSGPMGEVFNLGILSVPFTFLWIIFIINAINLMDGLDGLAAGVALIIITGFFLILLPGRNPFLMVLIVGLAGGLLGFLKYNYHPASIFMGDVGSLQLGYLLAFLSIELFKEAGSHQIYFLASLVIFGVPVSDTLISFLRRLGQGQNPFGADKEHIHHRLINLGLSHLETVWVLYLFTFLFVGMGVLMVFFKGLSGLILFSIALSFVIYWAWRLGYIETRASQLSLRHQTAMTTHVQKRAPLHLNRIWHILMLVLSDLITINLALYLSAWLKFRSGLIQAPVTRSPSDYFTSPVFLLLLIGWLLLFFINNLYRMGWDISRFDKIWRVTKVITFGSLFLGLLTIDYSQFMNESQVFSFFSYWILMVLLVNSGRLLIITLEKRFKILEYSPKKTLIIGCTEIGKKIVRDIQTNPHLIFEVVGFVSRDTNLSYFENLPILGSYAELPSIIHERRIEEIIIALEEEAAEEFLQVLSLTEQQQVRIKTPPGTHEMFIGRQEGLVSHAYLEIFPENMVMWQWMMKRIFDVVFSVICIILLLPFFTAVSAYLWTLFKKPIFVRIRVLGKFGVPFRVFVFRMTSVDEPVEKIQSLYLGSGQPTEEMNPIVRFVYKYRLYKLPQLINVLLGDMSFVGPRAESPEWYEEYQSSLSFIHRRVMIRPGLTGLAQVKYHYETQLKVLQERVKYDIFYIENMTLRLDARVLLRTLLLAFRKPGNYHLTPVGSELKDEHIH